MTSNTTFPAYRSVMLSGLASIVRNLPSTKYWLRVRNGDRLLCFAMLGFIAMGCLHWAHSNPQARTTKPSTGAKASLVLMTFILPREPCNASARATFLLRPPDTWIATQFLHPVLAGPGRRLGRREAWSRHIVDMQWGFPPDERGKTNSW